MNTTPDNELKPCPLCAGTEFEIEDDSPQGYINCKTCRMCFNRCEGHMEAVVNDGDTFAHMRNAFNRRSEPRSAKWMEIETAPKDGDFFIAYSEPHHIPIVAHWYAPMKCYVDYPFCQPLDRNIKYYSALPKPPGGSDDQ